MEALAFLNSLRPALPMSVERPCTEPSNGELRRWMRDGAVMLNGRTLRAGEDVGEVESLVFFPASQRRKTTLF
jgi:hypothetical protein